MLDGMRTNCRKTEPRLKRDSVCRYGPGTGWKIKLKSGVVLDHHVTLRVGYLDEMKSECVRIQK